MMRCAMILQKSALLRSFPDDKFIEDFTLGTIVCGTHFYARQHTNTHQTTQTFCIRNIIANYVIICKCFNFFSFAVRTNKHNKMQRYFIGKLCV